MGPYKPLLGWWVYPPKIWKFHGSRWSTLCAPMIWPMEFAKLKLLGDVHKRHLGPSGCWTKNRGILPPKSSILKGFSMIFTIHFGVPLFLETPKSVSFSWVGEMNLPSYAETTQASCQPFRPIHGWNIFFITLKILLDFKQCKYLIQSRSNIIV